MAIYHCSIKPVQRSKGRSSVAAAAYRSGDRLEDNRTGLTHDFSRKSGVDYTEIIGFNGSRSDLWNAAESAERRKDATTAREYEIAIPNELSRLEKKVLVSAYGQWLNQRHGVAVDIAIHDLEGKNPHAHILTTTRQSGGDQLGDKVAREWSDTKRKKEGLPGRKADLEESRKQWEVLSNKALEQAGHYQRIDHRSLADQGIERVPQIHLGPNVIQMEKRGIQTERALLSKAIEQDNQEANQLHSLRQSIDTQIGPETILEEIQRKFGRPKEPEDPQDKDLPDTLSVAELFKHYQAKREDNKKENVRTSKVNDAQKTSQSPSETISKLSDAYVVRNWEKLIAKQIESLKWERQQQLRLAEDQKQGNEMELNAYLQKEPRPPKEPKGLGSLFKRKEYQAAFKAYEEDHKRWSDCKSIFFDKEKSLLIQIKSASESLENTVSDAYKTVKDENNLLNKRLKEVVESNKPKKGYEITYKWDKESQVYMMKVNGLRPDQVLKQDLLDKIKSTDPFLKNCSDEEIYSGIIDPKHKNGVTPRFRNFDHSGKERSPFIDHEAKEKLTEKLAEKENSRGFSMGR